MIKHQLTQDRGLVMATVNWQFAEKCKSLTNKTHSFDNAVHFVRSTEKKILIETLTRYINQRLNVFKFHYAGQLSMKRANDLAKVQNLKSILNFQSLKGVCTTILLYRDSLIALLPPSRSRLYAHDSKTIHEIFSDCQQILNSEILE